MRSPLLLLVLMVIAATSGCAPLAEIPRVPPTPFEAASVRIGTPRDTVRLAVELARTEGQQAVGLMDRAELDENAGMLFIYEEIRDASAAFHMYRTLIPLDIAFLDETGVILRIQEMEPCPSTVARNCFHYVAGVEFLAALEVNRGYFDRREIGVGDRVLLEELAGRAGG